MPKKQYQHNYVYLPESERGKYDPRALDVQGRLSRSRMLVIEGLKTFGKDGATKEELGEFIGADLELDSPLVSIGITLNKMRASDLAQEIKGKWYLNEYAPFVQFKPPPDLPVNGKAAPIAPFAGKRSGKTVSIYTSPEILSDVIAISLLIKDQWFELPFFDSIRLCRGEQPDWGAEMRRYTNVTEMKIIYVGGRVETREINPREIITIAPGE